MKNFSTTRFGEITYNPSQVFLFAQGIVGFPHLKNFVLLNKENDSSMYWLQSLDDEEIAFVLVEPSKFIEKYKAELSLDELKLLKATDLEDLNTYIILTLPGSVEQITANLKAPIFLNEDLNIGGQVILTRFEYSSRYRIHDGKALDQQDIFSNEGLTSDSAAQII